MDNFGGEVAVLKSSVLKVVYFGRKYQCCKNVFSKKTYYLLLKYYSNKLGIEIVNWANIGSGFAMVHPYGITITSEAVLGKNCILLKGSTIGYNRSSKTKRGAPILGDRVWMGCNSTIIGKVFIGNDVMIAANTFVNFNVPDHSVVMGNPATVRHVENPTKDYIYGVSK